MFIVATERQMSIFYFHKLGAVTDLLMLPKNSSEVRVAVTPHSPLSLLDMFPPIPICFISFKNISLDFAYQPNTFLNPGGR